MSDFKAKMHQNRFRLGERWELRGRGRGRQGRGRGGRVREGRKGEEGSPVCIFKFSSE